MKDWYQKAEQLFQLSGKSEGTTRQYVRAIRQLVDYYQKTPDLITEEEVKFYFLFRINSSG